ncbi:hypothetical protein SAMN06269185_3205 [Natronoarchaeum philippinense]|uniref:Uncharacterized protein n=1 Tax=Natronoarchaeum philippinense TaxID=558529 RepID=A0A285P8G2_NATPI|nr:hypothetical protein [Natronoarchaeum philippinense]SNZ18035.1 hypothetical protein SAMN06269185_3205 [Natronoarchaeum philippinense]
MGVDYGDAWTYESIVGAIPGVHLSNAGAVALQLVLFEVAVLVLAAVYGLWDTALVGTVAVAVAGAGSAVMLHVSERVRALGGPDPYRQLLFGSRFEVVLGLLAFLVFVTHLFVYDPRQAGEPLVEALFGVDPPLPAVYLALLIGWDVCYRIGTGWWASVVAVWRSYRYRGEFTSTQARAYSRLDAWNVVFAVVQLSLVPFVRDRPLLVVALVGHVLAVGLATGLSVLLLRSKGETVTRT